MASVVFIAGCSKKEDEPPPLPVSLDDGVFIINEGPYVTGTGTISFLKRDGSYLENNIFQKTNQLMPLGNIVSSMTIVDGMAFIAVNNAARIVIVQLPSFISMGSIDNIDFPAYILRAGETTAYVSCWDNTVKIIDIQDYKVVGQIPAGTGPTKMERVDDFIWVLNQGGLGIDSTVTIIDVSANQVLDTIAVYPRPTGITQDKDGRVWIMCSGRGYWHPGGASPGHLLALDRHDFSVVRDLEFPDSDFHPEKLVVNSAGNVLFYNYPGGIFRFDIEDETLPQVPFVEWQGIPYSLGYDSLEDVLYTSDPVDYIQKGKVFRYYAADGSLKDSYSAGVVPSEYTFVP